MSRNSWQSDHPGLVATVCLLAETFSMVRCFMAYGDFNAMVPWMVMVNVFGVAGIVYISAWMRTP